MQRPSPTPTPAATSVRSRALERVEGLGAGTLLAQQSQLDLAYLYWKTNEKAQALSTIERFIKYNPSSPALDYACTCAA
jgi:outer membrane protein assembly factor BamD